MPFTKVLFPVDFSERSRAVAPHVKAVCARFRSELTLLHLVELPIEAYAGVEAPVMFQFPVADMKHRAERQLNEFAANFFPGSDPKLVIEEGDPGSRISELARTSGADLIMLPTRGRGVFRAALLGSVAAKTLHDAECPVWTEAHCESAGASHAEWKHVICAVDPASGGARLVHFAAELAKTSGVSVRLVHVVPQGEGIEKYFDREFTAFLMDRARHAIAAIQQEAGTSFEVHVGAGNVPQVLREEAVSSGADLVVIGRGCLPHFAGRLRSNVYAIVRDMSCPVISL
jgi:nucleotide-binding universal stress UspA family protein